MLSPSPTKGRHGSVCSAARAYPRPRDLGNPSRPSDGLGSGWWWPAECLADPARLAPSLDQVRVRQTGGKGGNACSARGDRAASPPDRGNRPASRVREAGWRPSPGSSVPRVRPEDSFGPASEPLELGHQLRSLSQLRQLIQLGPDLAPRQLAPLLEDHPFDVSPI